jgi:type I restriction-modification system DNA methylase subunit
MPRGKGKSGNSSNGATLGFERELWKAADTLRGSMDAAEYKHVVLGLIFLKYISDAFEECRQRLNLAIRGIDDQIDQGDTFVSDASRTLGQTTSWRIPRST